MINNHKAEFSTTTDTEVLYQCIHFEGLQKTLSVINGMFSFAYYDVDKEKIFLCRDHLGIKPLYYTKSDDLFCVILIGNKTFKVINCIRFVFIV